MHCSTFSITMQSKHAFNLLILKMSKGVPFNFKWKRKDIIYINNHLSITILHVKYIIFPKWQLVWHIQLISDQLSTTQRPPLLQTHPQRKQLIPYYPLSPYITPYHPISPHITLYYPILPHITAYDPISPNITPYHHIAPHTVIGRRPAMGVRMPTLINKFLNDESIAVQIICLDVYTWN